MFKNQGSTNIDDWIEIKSRDDLPKDGINTRYLARDGNGISKFGDRFFNSVEIENQYLDDNITKFRPIKENGSLLGNKIPKETRGILFICKFNTESIEVVSEKFYGSSWHTVEAYANIPNPESHMVGGETYEDMIKELNKLKDRWNTEDHIFGLNETI